MKKTKIALLLLFLVSQGSFLAAQQFDWVRKVGIKRNEPDSPFPNHWNIDPRIEADLMDNVYVTGNFKDTLVFETTSIISAGSYDFFITKYNPQGQTKWIKQIKGLNDQTISDLVLD